MDVIVKSPVPLKEYIIESVIPVKIPNQGIKSNKPLINPMKIEPCKKKVIVI